MADIRQHDHPTVFVSYKWGEEDQNAWVERLARDLRTRGINALLDKWEVRLGESFSNYMTSAISRSDALLFVITKSSVSAVENPAPGGAVKFEVQLATARRLSGSNFRFIGILREGDRAPTHLSDTRYIDFRDDARYRHSLATLVADLAGITSKPGLAMQKDLTLLAEPVVFRLWERLPHGGAILVEPAPSVLQQEILRGILQLAQAGSKKRGYDLVIVDAVIPQSLQQTDLLDRVNRFTHSEMKLDFTAFDKTDLDIQLLFGQPAWQSTSSQHRRLVMFFRIVGQFSRKQHVVLHELRALQEMHHYGRAGQVPLTIILMASDVEYSDPGSRYSSWSNVFEVIRVS